MGSITIVGLGPGDARHLTREAWEVLESTREVWLRTERHPTASNLPPGLKLHSFDYLYDDGEDFAKVYDAIARRVLEMGQRPGGVVYGVPGHPLVGEATVEAILASAGRLSLPVRVVEGLSFVEPTLTALRIDALQGLQIVDAIDLARSHHPPLNPDLPALVGQLYSRLLASEVKLTLMNQYPDDHEVILVHAAGTLEERIAARLLYELDRADDAAAPVAHLTTLYVPPLADVASFEGLQKTVAHLRAPEGCPWDREQTHESLRTCLLEEAYESVGAIDRGDIDALQEELGDLLLQVLLQTQIATEAGEFKMPDVILGIDGKLKRRHPHVWGGREVADTHEVLHNWEELKREEKQDRSSVLDGVPRVLPALQKADTYGRRVARVGFDWHDVDGVVVKVREEVAELESASTHERQEAELGDLLFAVANWARWLGIDPESALRQANARFARRFRWLERVAIERGLDAATLSIDELEALWQEAKRSEEES
jgi:tetrapyrrole methylase family protein/MazG family protein